ncbi:trypsin-like serine peptidase [Corallococcus caeni]|uniref:trypsin-like serine peptidase n=1 Tax=Corallococcus caeni TaxID=3082388 RepID=UPI00336553C2
MGCTGTHLGGGIVLTAQHCLSRTPGTMKEGMCDDVEVEWGYRFGVMPYLTSRCIKVVDGEYSKDRDYAFILVQPAPPATVEVETGQRPMKERRLTIFGHPQGRPLEWSGTCVLHLGTEGKFLSQYFFSHQCDTEPGSSGSAVLDDETLRIVGVHDGGEIFDTRNGKPWGWNYATYLVDTPVRSVLPGARPQETVPEGLPPSSPAIEGVGAGIPRQGINNP